jgi:hypothetical protein
VKAHAAQAHSGLAKDTTPTGDDRLDQLERLAKLRESGVLTDAELEREKQRVLA